MIAPDELRAMMDRADAYYAKRGTKVTKLIFDHDWNRGPGRRLHVIFDAEDKASPLFDEYA